MFNEAFDKRLPPTTDRLQIYLQTLKREKITERNQNKSQVFKSSITRKDGANLD